MESLISKLVAEHFLLYFEHLLIKQNIDNGSSIFHTQYIDNRLIICGHTKINSHKYTKPRQLNPQ